MKLWWWPFRQPPMDPFLFEPEGPYSAPTVSATIPFRVRVARRNASDECSLHRALREFADASDR